MAVGEAALGARLVVDRGEDVGLGPRVADRRKDALRPAQVEKEVVDERNFRHGRGILRSRMRILATIALFVALTAPAAAAKRAVPRGWLGVVVDGPLLESSFTGGPAEWDRMAGSGAEAARAAVYWSAVQPSGPADADFTASDALILDAARRHLGVLPVLQGT